MEERVGEPGGRGPCARGRPAPPAHDVRPRDDARARLLHRASRTTRATCRGARRARRPWTLLDYFPPDWLLVVDESHMTIPQVVGMYKNDRTRKEILVDFGFRLPSALDNRPLTFEEFQATVHQADLHERDAGAVRARAQHSAIVQQLIRPTGHRRPADHGPPDRGPDRRPARADPGPRRARRAGAGHDADQEDGRGPADYLKELGVKVQYLHSEVDTLERVAILRDLRLGVFDVLVGINLLREGIDLPEVTLVAILDADKEGFLRSAWSLIQMIGRAARNTGGEVIMYADTRHRVDARRDRRDRPPAGDPGGLQPRARHRADDDRQGHPRPQRAASRRRRVDRRLRLRARGGEFSEADRAKVEALVARMEAEMRAPPSSSSSSAPRRSATRSSRSGCASSRRTPRSPSAAPPSGRRATPAGPAGRGLTGAADRARGRRGAAAAVAAGPTMEVTAVTVLPADEEPADTLDGDARRARHRREHHRRLAAGHPRRARRRRRAGRPAGSTARPGTGR